MTRLRKNLSSSDLSFFQSYWGRRKGTEEKFFEAEAVGRGWEMFPRFPFFYRGNWGNPQIRQGHIFSKTVARTNIETECFFQFFGFFVAFISQIFIQMNLQKYLKTKYIWWKKWQKYFSFRRGKIFLPYLTRRGKIFLP